MERKLNACNIIYSTDHFKYLLERKKEDLTRRDVDRRYLLELSIKQLEKR